MLAAAFLLPLEVKKKTAGKNSQPFQEDVLQQVYPQRSYFSPAFTALQIERLKVIVFQRAGAEAVAAANG